MLAVFALGGCVLLWRFPPTEQSFWPKCLFHTVTGLLCPGCGATRGLYALLHGRVLYSLQCNLFLIPAPILCLFAWCFPHFPHWRPLFWCLVAGALVYGIVRNLPIPLAQYLVP